MQDEQELLSRITTAISRIRNLADGSGGASSGEALEPLAARIGRLTADNDALRNQLGELKEKREADVQELDNLLSELRPLIEEVS